MNKPLGKLFLSFTEIDLLNLIIKILRDNYDKIDILHISDIRLDVKKLYNEFKDHIDDVNYTYQLNTETWYSLLNPTDRIGIDTDVFSSVCVNLLRHECKSPYIFVYNIENKLIKTYKYA